MTDTDDRILSYSAPRQITTLGCATYEVNLPRDVDPRVINRIKEIIQRDERTPGRHTRFSFKFCGPSS